MTSLPSEEAVPVQGREAVEITPEMVEVGVRVFEEWEDSEDASIRNLVTTIYREMREREGQRQDRCTR
jgi:hypothetical protein